jgi:WD40-like Beta Propeller Repeat
MQKFMEAIVLSAIVICPAQAQQFSDWSPPVSLGAVINSAGNEAGSSISKDGLSFYFQSDRPGGLGLADIYVSRRASINDPWGPPQNLGPVVNSTASEQMAWISPGGRRLYFASDRAGGMGGLDLYVSRRRNKHDDLGWGPPENLGSGVNTAEPEFFGSIVKERRSGKVLYFARGDLGARDLYMSVRQRDGTFGVAVPIGELQDPADDARPALRRDGLEMYFDSNRQGGEFDIWVTTRVRPWHPWSTPVNVAVLNSSAQEARPALSWDAKTIYFHSGRPGGLGGLDIYVSTRTKLDDIDVEDDEDEEEDDD